MYYRTSMNFVTMLSICCYAVMMYEHMYCCYDHVYFTILNCFVVHTCLRKMHLYSYYVDMP